MSKKHENAIVNTETGEIRPITLDQAINEYLEQTQYVPRVKTYFNAHLRPYHGETFITPSLTIPDQTMDIREILNRYAQGLPIEQKEPIFNEEEMLPDWKKMDLSERYDFINQNKAEISRLQAELQNQQAKPTPEPLPGL